MVDLDAAMVGDKFRVRADLESGKMYGDYFAAPSMVRLPGTVVTVANKLGSGRAVEIVEDGCRCFWTGEMFEYIQPPPLLTDYLIGRDNNV